MTPPRAPNDVETIRSAVKFLGQHAEEGNDLGEVAELLEDIADGKWTLVPHRPSPVFVKHRSVGLSVGQKPMCGRDSSVACGSPDYCVRHGCQL